MFRKISSAVITLLITIQFVIPPQFVSAQSLPVPGTMIQASAVFVPAMLKAVTVDPNNPLKFNFIVDTGDSGLEADALEAETMKLVKYFLATITTPEDQIWVNLSPYEKDRIVADGLAHTDLGKDLLAQDYILKQLTASLMYPENELGQTFYNRVRAKLEAKYGITEVPLDTFNKVWIVPQKATVYQEGNTALIVDSYLKVMLEEDYLALEREHAKTAEVDEMAEITKQAVREVIIPEIEREVNEGENFANLRQIYNSMLLATWYKKTLKESLLGQVYMDQGKTAGIETDNPNVTQEIYSQYLEAFEVGVYDYIREEYDPQTQETLPRKYFSGGAKGFKAGQVDLAMNIENREKAFQTRGPVQAFTYELKQADKAMINPDKEPFPGDEDVPVWYFGDFGDITSELSRGNTNMKSILGGKGANLAEMANDLADQFADFVTEKGKDPNKIKLRIPPGFTTTTEQTKRWHDLEEEAGKGKISKQLRDVVMTALNRLEAVMGRRLGDTEKFPVLVAVRSGAAESMPGMMDTILNLGMNDENISTLIELTDERFAWDSYRRFIEMYGRTVLEIEEDEEAEDDISKGFKYALEKKVEARGVESQVDLEADDYRELVDEYRAIITAQGFDPIPQDPVEQLFNAIETVMRSTFNERAFLYREQDGLKLEDTISAVNILPMIYGNRNQKSGSGVFFTRDLITGEKNMNLEFDFFAQGEDVVAGRSKNQFPLSHMQEKIPEIAENLTLVGEFLEKYFRNVQDIEFTFEHDEETGETTLYILQTRNAKRTSAAEIVSAYDMVEEGLISEEEAVRRITPDKLNELLVPRFDKEDMKRAISEGRLLSTGGLNASPGGGVGHVMLNSDRAKETSDRIKAIRTRIKNGEKVSESDREYASVGMVLAREETSPDDLHGMIDAEAIVTRDGGRTSHAAVVSRQMGIPAVVGDNNIEFDFEAKTISFIQEDGSKRTFNEGSVLAIDGEEGQVFEGVIKTVPSIVETAQAIESLPKLQSVVGILQKWIDTMEDKESVRSQLLLAEYERSIIEYQERIVEIQELELTPEQSEFYRKYQAIVEMARKIREDNDGMGLGANAERPLDIWSAIMNGAERFGLVRTEHMFSGNGRELRFQQMILSEEDADSKKTVLDIILNQQQADFEQIFLMAEGRPVTIRLIDPPLHEFLPREEEKVQELAELLNISVAETKQRIDRYSEDNPMFGTRGVRLSVVFPEIIEMQTRAIFNAQAKVRQEGIRSDPEIMVPLAGDVAEFNFVKDRIMPIAEEMGLTRKVDFKLGVMVEITAGAINAANLAREIDFISFGTNDLTQGVLKISRDDGKEYLTNAIASEVYEFDPFVTLAPEVAAFIKRTIEAVRAVDPNMAIKCGICGEQGVDVQSIEDYLSPYGFTYVSGGPRRLPIAQIALAKEALKDYEPLTARVTPPIELKERAYDTIDSLKNRTTARSHMAEAVRFVDEFGNDLRVKKQALANIDISLATDEANNVEAMQTVLLWAQGIKNLDVSVSASSVEEKSRTNDRIGLFETEETFTDPVLRSKLQEIILTLDSSRQEELLQDIGDELIQYFYKNLGRASEAQRTMSVRLPNIAIKHLFDRYETEEDRQKDLRALAQSLDIPVEEVERKIEVLGETNSAIGQRGSRIFFTKLGPIYHVLSQTIIEAAQRRGFETVDLILPFIANGKEISVIRDGFINAEGEQLVASLDEMIKSVVDNGETKIRIGTNIETPAAVFTAANITSVTDGPIVIHARRLTEAVWAAFEGDAKQGFLDAYLENGIWKENPYEITPEDVMQLIVEAIAKIKAVDATRTIKLIANPQDRRLIQLAHQMGVSEIIVESNELNIGILAAARAAAVGVDKAQIAEEIKIVQERVGGIDLNPDTLDFNILRNGEGIPLPVNMQPLENLQIDGFAPVMINYTPVSNLPLFLGLAKPTEGTDQAQDLDPYDRKARLESKDIEELSYLN